VNHDTEIAVSAALKTVAAERSGHRYAVSVGLALGLLLLGLLVHYEGRQAEGWARFPESKVVANARTEWMSRWLSRDSVEAVQTPLYVGQDESDWAERHIRLVRATLEARP
jgi:hypothetical protein